MILWHYSYRYSSGLDIRNIFVVAKDEKEAMFLVGQELVEDRAEFDNNIDDSSRKLTEIPSGRFTIVESMD